MIMLFGDRLLPGKLPAAFAAKVAATGRRTVPSACRERRSAVVGMASQRPAQPIGIDG
jgi:hypothetical protein